ncbi:hypothetical protein AMS68_005999 [Peltaster fructicola]|uniref:Nucleolar protein 56 n=1 Tax=Peltaster fructicola TaxID=286661 RepID=A0A6H0Y0C4_9PEZI|nr:hypothetical protein AMS68_005999 [Peltaster fructicola]
MSVDYLLHESSLGYALFKVKLKGDATSTLLKEVQDGYQQLDKFGKMIKLQAFAPFRNSNHALLEMNAISEGVMSDYLAEILDANLPKAGEKGKTVTLGVNDKALVASIKKKFPHVTGQTPSDALTADLLRGIRFHAGKLLKDLQEGDIERGTLGLGHHYSRGKVKFNVAKNDNHIIQAIATLDHLEKAVNTFSMRVREWYGWHFPELVRIVSDNHKYAQCAMKIGDKGTLDEDSIDGLIEIVDDESVARAIVDAARVSMGQELSAADMENVMAFAKRAVSLANYRKQLTGYLSEKMGVVAPNLSALIGDSVGARLIQKAGSLTNLAKYPASTVQILGAEKALFRALKTKGNTPKYGLIYHSSFIGRAGQKNKGRISRFLANKASIASRIDTFNAEPTRKFGEALKEQVEERLRFYAEGINPTKNEDAMKAAMDAALKSINVSDSTADGGLVAEEAIDAPGVTAGATEKAVRDKKNKKDKKKDRASLSAPQDVEMADANDEDDEEAAKLAHKAAKAAKKAKKAAEQAAGAAADAEASTKKSKKEKRKSEGGESEKPKKKSKA